jgi:hypothetical protein
MANFQSKYFPTTNEQFILGNYLPFLTSNIHQAEQHFQIHHAEQMYNLGKYDAHLKTNFSTKAQVVCSK